MRSIFLGEERQINRVYSPDVIGELSVLAELDKKTYKKEDVISEKAAFEDVEFIFSTWGMPAFSSVEIKRHLPSLKAVFYAAGSVQHFARPFLENGIRVYSAWAANGVPVAEFALSQILLANKGYFQCLLHKSREMRKNASAIQSAFPGNFNGKVGIIGAGMIGTLVINLLKNHKVDILVFDPFLSDEKAKSMGIEKCSLEQLFAESQTISNHLANNEQTVGMLNYSLFEKMKDNATFINTGRGAQVVESDLVKKLKESPNVVALLDVTYPEPPEEGHAFYSLPNVFMTPHIAGSTGNEVIRMSEYMLDECKNVLDGMRTKHEITLEMLATMA